MSGVEDPDELPAGEKGGTHGREEVPIVRRPTRRRTILLAAGAIVAAVVGYRGYQRLKPIIGPHSSQRPDTTTQLRVRRSITDLQNQYTAGNTTPLEDLWRAWIGIAQLPADDPRSFFAIAGYHGLPFRGLGATDPHSWGGYCHHGNVLFPTWHRVYLVKLEEALRSVPGCQDVTLPYWDETSADSAANGIPWALTQKTVELDGRTIPNPLRSFIFNTDVVDTIATDDPFYSKPKGYETVRYPLSGLVGTPQARTATAAHNALYPDYNYDVALLNGNITDWLTGTVIIDGQPVRYGQIADKYRKCLDAPNYTVFSNKTSAAQWNDEATLQAPPGPTVVSVDAPHNGIHLAVGGFDAPGYRQSPIEGANGDMGENETAGFDPIFFFHHCFVDRVFWLWQQRHGAADELDIIAGYKGTSSSDWQGPTPGMAPDTPLDLNTPLHPFTKPDGTPYTSVDCINIETKLGYTYGPGSLQDLLAPETSGPEANSKVIAVSGISPTKISGSFLVSAFGTTGGQRTHLGTEAVLSHWNVSECGSCQTDLDVMAFFGVPPAGAGLMPAVTEAALAEKSSYVVEVRTHDRVIYPREPVTEASPGSRPPGINDELDLRFEIR
jgi:tyrosinase